MKTHHKGTNYTYRKNETTVATERNYLDNFTENSLRGCYIGSTKVAKSWMTTADCR